MLTRVYAQGAPDTYAPEPVPRGTGQLAQDPEAPSTVRTPYAYPPLPCRTHRAPWHTRRTFVTSADRLVQMLLEEALR